MTAKRKQVWEELARYGLDTTQVEVVQAVVTGNVPLPEGLNLDKLKFLLAGRSRAEMEWRRVGMGLIGLALRAPIVFQGYEWFSFKVPGGSYTPDFNYLADNGRWAHVEIKGSKLQKNYRDARSHLRAAATLNPWFCFYEARFEKAAWKLEMIEPDLEFLAGIQLKDTSANGGNDGAGEENQTQE